MGVEIERKFLLRNEDWRAQIERSEPMAQGYLVGAPAILQGHAKSSVRLRRSGEAAWLNIKSATLGVSRAEYEYPVPLADAEAMLAELCDGLVEKIRHHLRVDGHHFEIDEFLGANAGLIVAELELPTVDAVYPKPAWLGREVSHLPRYYNIQLIEHPYAQWSVAERVGEDTGVAITC